nr:PREDICTED: maltase 2-like [Bemisia tabaci]XP_018917588.1 PREDICTED: maltase 2-like [Bemisia tabaci]XP_018917589.1 PREDICTED: maltase 2-like [Bemisia tabaci]
MERRKILGLLFLTGAIFCTALTQPIEAETGSKRVQDLDWWQSGVIYQIYPRSFKDSNSDSIGDLDGITEKMDYLKSLGITGVWLSPIYESPQADFGYDISDFRKIDQFYGTFEDFARLREAVQSRGLKLLLDFIPNHTSDEHEWFEKSVQNIQPFADYYVWRDARYENGTRLPPNNWVSFFDGSAWTWNENRQKYYLHQYHEKQPDLNYRNPAVLEEMKEVMRFWLDAGVDGFRVDSCNTLVEDARFLDEPRSYLTGVRENSIQYLNHVYTQDQPETYDIIHQFRQVLDEYSKKETNMIQACDTERENCTSLATRRPSTRAMMTEAYVPIKDTMRFYGNSTHQGAHFPFNFFLITDLDRQSQAQDYLRVINMWMSNMPEGHWPNWVLGNHDRPRIATRFGPELVDGLHMIQFILPGTAITYFGDEIAMEDTFIRWDETVDPFALGVGKEHYLEVSRDGCRAPFLWDNTLSAGFSTLAYTWLPVNPNFYRSNLQIQMEDAKSHFKVYKKLVQLKKKPVIQFGTLNVKTLSRQTLMIERVDRASQVLYVTVVNTGSYYDYIDLSELLSLPLPNLTVYASSVNSMYAEGTEVSPDRLRLRPKEALILTNEKPALQKEESKDETK